MRPDLHLIFKTHLDLGFTGYAADVRHQYHDYFIPMALDTGEHFLREDPTRPQFIWTTGSWLIWDHLNTQGPDKVARLERAIAAGIVRWHALPFTTHTELMSPSLVREALSISAELDARFGLKTRAAKMTDVPGHTRGLVGLLAEAGVDFLHIGVNSASKLPDVPPVFRWRDTAGAEVLVMYQSDYGTTMVPEGMSSGIAFAHTNDNMGPQNVGHVVDAFASLAQANPGFAVRASTLDDFAAALAPYRSQFPVVDQEIGDSWIHGVGSAPQRISRYLSARRTYERFASEGLTPARKAFGRKLLEVPEHTWGVDIKTYLRDDSAWDRGAFDVARQMDPRFAITEQSWAEQDSIIDAALAHLPAQDSAIAALPTPISAPAGAVLTAMEDHYYPLGPCSVRFNPTTGGVMAVHLADGSLVQAEPGSAGLFAFGYESYDAADVDAYQHSYLTAWPRWAVLDHGKPGLSASTTASSGQFWPEQPQIAVTPDRLVMEAQMPRQSVTDLGAPARVRTQLECSPEGILVTMTLVDKPANRMPEAGFATLPMMARPDSWRMKKLGQSVSPDGVIASGNRQLHVVEAVLAVTQDGMCTTICPLDAPLFCPGDLPFLPFGQAQPDMRKGGRFNLFNNKWGTNFSMWCAGDLTFRFTLNASTANGRDRRA